MRKPWVGNTGLTANVIVGGSNPGRRVQILQPTALPASSTVAISNGILDYKALDFTLNSMIFSNPSTFASGELRGTGIATITSNLITVVGNPGAGVFGNAFAPRMVLNSDLTLRVGESDSTTFELSMNGKLSGPGRVILEPGITTTGAASAGGLNLSAYNTFTGGIVINSSGPTAAVGLANRAAAGTGAIVINDAGRLSASASGNVWPIPNAIQLNANASFDGLFTGPLDLNTISGSVNRSATVPLNFTATFGGTIGASTGIGGLTKSGPGILVLRGANTYTGGTFLQEGTLVVGNDAALSTGALTITGVATSFLTDTSRTISNPLVFAIASNSSLSLGENQQFTDPTMTLSGEIDLNATGTSGLTRTIAVFGGATHVISGPIGQSGPTTNLTFIGNRLVLSGNNSYTGTTTVNGGTLTLAGSNSGGGATVMNNSGTLEFSADSNFASGTITVNAGGTLRPLTSATFARLFAVVGNATLDVVGQTPTFAAGFTGTSASTLTKTGTGTVIFPGSAALGTLNLAVAGGGVTFTDNGTAIGVPTITVSNDGELTLDNSGTNLSDRLNGNITLSGGIFVFKAASTGGSMESFGTLNVASGNNKVTIDPNGGVGTSLVAGAYTAPTTGNQTVIRGTNLGTPGGAQVFLTGVANGAFLPNLMGDTSLTGTGNTFLQYSTANGVVPVTYQQTNGDIRNPANGGTTATTANVLINGATSNNVSIPTANTINSLTLAGANPTVNVGFGSGTLTLTVTNGILVQNGATGAVLNNGTLAFGSSAAQFITQGNLAVSSGLTGTGGLTKSGSGTLTLSGPYSLTGVMAVNQGTLALNTNASATGLTGTGTVQIGPGRALTLTSSGTVGPQLSGAGTVNFNGNATYTINTENSHNQSNVGPGANIVLTAPNGLGANAKFNNLSDQNNLLTFNSGGVVNTNLALSTSGQGLSAIRNNAPASTVTLAGLISGGSVSNRVFFRGVNFDSVIRLTNPNNSFGGRVSMDSGTVAITSDGALGDAGNWISTQGAYGLRLETNGMVVNHAFEYAGAIRVPAGQTATLAGPVKEALAKWDQGTLIWTGNQTGYLGSIAVREGTLQLDTYIGFVSQAGLFLYDGARLSGTGRLQSAVVAEFNTTIAPGTPTTAGMLSVTGIDMRPGVKLSVNITGSALGTGYDMFEVTGLAQLGDGFAFLEVLTSGPQTPGSTFLIMSRGAGSPAGNFEGLVEGDMLTSGIMQYRISYQGLNYSTGLLASGADGNDIVLTAISTVPEPSTIAMLVGCGAATTYALLRRRRRSAAANDTDIGPDLDSEESA